MPEYVSSTTLVSEIVRTFKAVTMYPDSHPERRRFFDRLIKSISAYLRQNKVFEIRIEGRDLRVDDLAVETNDGSHELLARECFARQVAAVKFLQGAGKEDLEQFFKLLTMEPEAVRDAGGALEIVRQNASGLLQVEQVDYAGILERRVEATVEEGSRYLTGIGAPVAVPDGLAERGSSVPNFRGTDEKEVSQQEWLDNKLMKLDEAQTDEQYRSVLGDIMSSLKTTENMNLPAYSLHVLKHLGQHLLTGSPPRNPEAARSAVRDLAKPERIEGLIKQLTVKDQPQKESIQAVFEEVKEVSIPVLLRCLADEEEAFGRGVILNALERYGGSLRPHLENWLKDDRWYVVRNAIGLLRQVGDSRDSTNIRTFLNHPNSKVRLEALRFLNRHPVHVSEDRMASLLEDEDIEVQARAIYALGVLLGPKGLKRLKSLARKPLLGEGDVATREMAIRGIGRQGDREALSFLQSLLEKRSFLRPAKGERVLKAVVSTLVEIDDPAAVKIFQDVLPRLKGETLRTAEEFLRRKEKKTEGKGSDEEKEDWQPAQGK
jgi:HEAT repeat protein